MKLLSLWNGILFGVSVFVPTQVRLVFAHNLSRLSRKNVGGVKVGDLPGLEALQQPGTSILSALSIPFVASYLHSRVLEFVARLKAMCRPGAGVD